MSLGFRLDWNKKGAVFRPQQTSFQSAARRAAESFRDRKFDQRSGAYYSQALAHIGRRHKGMERVDRA